MSQAVPDEPPLYTMVMAAWGSLNGRGRKWRDTYAKFDRWALSERINFEIPKTWAEFKAAVESVPYG